MLEIKFRGKRDDNGEWVYGSFIPDALEGGNSDLVSWGFIRRYNRDVGKMETIEVDRETVGQDTGLKDRDGDEIWEGDVIQEFAGEHAQGVWEFSNVSVVEDLRWIPESLGFADCTYIIGNIHDNPGLMEVTE